MNQNHCTRDDGRNTHLVEVGNLSDIYEIDHRKVLDFLRDRIKSLVHGHTLAVPIMTKPDNDNAVFFGLDGFVNMPARR